MSEGTEEKRCHPLLMANPLAEHVTVPVAMASGFEPIGGLSEDHRPSSLPLFYLPLIDIHWPTIQGTYLCLHTKCHKNMSIFIPKNTVCLSSLWMGDFVSLVTFLWSEWVHQGLWLFFELFSCCKEGGIPCSDPSCQMYLLVCEVSEREWRNSKPLTLCLKIVSHQLPKTGISMLPPPCTLPSPLLFQPYNWDLMIL